MRLDEIAASFSIDPEKERLFAKQVCLSLRGRVRWSAGMYLRLFLQVFVLLLVLSLVGSGLPGFLVMLLMSAGTIGGFVAFLYALRWELTFDGESGWMSFSTLTSGTIRFHVSEISRIWEDSSRLCSRGSLRRQELLFIAVGRVTIPVVLRKYLFEGKHTHQAESGGYADAAKLHQYLDLYQKYLAPPDFGLTPEDDGIGISPAVAAAIAAQRSVTSAAPESGEAAAPESPEAASSDAPETPEAPSAVSEAPEAPPAPAKSDIPEASTTSARKDAPEKPQVDVDALFNSVLRDFGKKR